MKRDSEHGYESEHKSESEKKEGVCAREKEGETKVLAYARIFRSLCVSVMDEGRWGTERVDIVQICVCVCAIATERERGMKRERSCLHL